MIQNPSITQEVAGLLGHYFLLLVLSVLRAKIPIWLESEELLLSLQQGSGE